MEKPSAAEKPLTDKQLRAALKELRSAKMKKRKEDLERQLAEAAQSEAAIAEAVADINQEYAVVKFGASVRIICERYDLELDRPHIDFMKTADFKTFFANKRIALGEKKTVSASDIWLTNKNRRQYMQVIFAPGNTDERYYNLWRGFAFDPKQGCWTLFREHIRKNICQYDPALFRYVLAWMAEVVRQPCGRKPGVVLALKGKKGTGKSEFGRHYGKLFGPHYRMISQARHLVGNFNAHLANTLLVNAEEAFWAGDKASESGLKSLITAMTMTLEKKGQDAIEVPNRIRLLMTSNENWMVPAGMDERRFCVLEVGEEHRKDIPYFAAIDEQMREGGYAAMLYDLLHDPDIEIDGLAQVPMTKALLEQKILTLGDIPAFWYHCLDEGQITPARSWDDPQPCAEVYEQYQRFAKGIGISHRASPKGLGTELGKLCDGKRRNKEMVDVWRTNEKGWRVEDKERVWCYLFPPLPKCRESFTTKMQMPIPWPEEEKPQETTLPLN